MIYKLNNLNIIKHIHIIDLTRVDKLPTPTGPTIWEKTIESPNATAKASNSQIVCTASGQISHILRLWERRRQSHQQHLLELLVGT